MTRHFILLATLLLITTNLFSQEYETETFNGVQYYNINGDWHLLDEVGEEYIPLSAKYISLKYSQGTSPSQIEAFESQNNLSFERNNILGWYDYELNSTEDLLAQCKSIQSSTVVELVEVTAPVIFHVFPNDSIGYDPPTQTWEKWGIRATGVDKAWEKTKGDTSVVAAIIDSGVDWWHEDFAQATGTTGTFWLNSGEDAWTDPNDPTTGDGVDNDTNGYVDDWRGWNFAFGNNDVSDGTNNLQANPHGTSVAGVLGARSNNVIGIPGVAGGWGSTDGIKVMTVKFQEWGVTQDSMNSLALDDAIVYAAKNGADILNMSNSVYSNHSSIGDAFEFAYENHNCFLVSSSGNDSTTGNPVLFPANHPLVMSVAVSDRNDRAYKSRTGPKLDIGAPGDDMWTLYPNDSYVLALGTSEASPFVGGAAGLMFSINPCLDNEEVHDILIRRADRVHKVGQNPYNYNYDPFKPGHSLEIGYGRLNAEDAVNTAEAMHETTLDLYIKDHYGDFGYPNSYPNTVRFDDWSDIWVRNQPDGHTNQEMEEIEYSTQHDAYVYVKVRNKSSRCTTPPAAEE